MKCDVFDPKRHKPELKKINNGECVQMLLMSLIRIILHGHKSISDAAKLTSTTDEKKIPRIENGNMEIKEKEKENDVNNNIDRFIPPFVSRNIITVPTYCPEGERKDSRGHCRTVM